MLDRRRAAMFRALADACVSDYEPLIPGLTQHNPDDGHVLAAAISAMAQVIVTFNEADFPAATLAGFYIVVQHPDVFLRHLGDLNPATVRARVQQRLQGWRQLPNTPGAYIGALERTGLPEAAAALPELFVAG